MSMLESSAGALVLPPRLYSRKRKAPAADSAGGSESATRSSLSFFTEAGYARFSAYGDAAESKLFGDEELRRATCLAATTSSSSSHQPLASAARIGAMSVQAGSDAAGRATGTTLLAVQKLLQPLTASVQLPPPSRKHLMQILAERKDVSVMRVRADNIARRLSSLTIPQHEQYMQLLQKRIHAQRCGVPAILALTADETAQWQALDASVKEEQKLVYCELKVIATSELASLMTFVPASVESWYEKMLMQCRNDVFQMYPRYFEPSLGIAAQGEAGSGEVSVMKHVKEVFAHGTCPTVHEERFVHGMQIATATMNDAPSSSGGGDGGTFLMRNAISADVHAEKFMEKYDCDVAISSSTLVALFDFERQKGFRKPREWLIPVKSRVVLNKQGVAKKHVYFDKPLPAQSVSAREKMGLAGRASLLASLQANPIASPQPPHANAMRGRTVYHVWELDGRRILVRCTTHAHFVAKSSLKEENAKPTAAKSEPASKTSGVGGAHAPERSHPLSVFIKPDYRFLGVDEQITRSEKRRFWLHSWLRGSSVLLIGRLNPQSFAVDSWEKHSLASLVYGHDATHPPEWFEPTENFQVVNDAFAAVCNVPAGNHMMRSGSNGAIELLMATPGATIASSDADNSINSERLDLFQFIGSARDSSGVFEFVLPKWIYQHGRIPYCFRTGTYCVPFFLDGVCPTIAEKERCDAVHIRQSQSRSRGNSTRGKSSNNATWWFDDFSWHLKHATKADQKAHSSGSLPTRANWLRPDFPFCQLSIPVDPANPHSPVRCPKPQGECLLPHLTVHEVAERLADNELRVKRKQTKHGKKGYRWKRSPRQSSSS